MKLTPSDNILLDHLAMFMEANRLHLTAAYMAGLEAGAERVLAQVSLVAGDLGMPDPNTERFLAFIRQAVLTEPDNCAAARHADPDAPSSTSPDGSRA